MKAAASRRSTTDDSGAFLHADGLLTVDEFAALLHVSRWKAYHLIVDGEIPHVRVGRLLRVTRRDAQAFIESRREAVVA